MTNERIRVGFVSTRLAGTDGVSLETAKWVNVLTSLGHECFFFAGESDWPSERSLVVAEAHFEHPDILGLTTNLFQNHIRSPQTSQQIEKLKEHLKGHLASFVNVFRPNLLVAENVLSLPMNVPLGLALTEFIAETGIPVIAHHHDFSWERERFAFNAAHDYLRTAFPPVLPSVRHVVINSFAARQVAMRTGERTALIPNVMNFDAPPPESDQYAAEMRAALGIRPGEVFLLQPTRIVPRKRIERAIELAHRLELPSALVISHDSGDEGDEYVDYLRNYADLIGTHVIFASDRISYERTRRSDGQKVFSLADAYRQADLVTYPSTAEGFGNAFLEAVYFRRPIFMCSYEIFDVDIKPKGFHVIAFQDFISEAIVNATRALLNDRASVAREVEENYHIAQRYYSFRALENRLVVLMNECLGT
jgi:glycosyltransferase involved in cell wall biosynthesis